RSLHENLSSRKLAQNLGDCGGARAQIRRGHAFRVVARALFLEPLERVRNRREGGIVRLPRVPRCRRSESGFDARENSCAARILNSIQCLFSRERERIWPEYAAQRDLWSTDAEDRAP